MCVFCLSLSLFPFSSVRQDTFKATQCRCDVRSTPYRFKIEFQTWIFISNFSHQIIIEIMDEMLTSHWMWNVHYILTWQTERLFTVHIQFLDRRGRGKGQTFSLEKKIKWVHVLLILIELDESPTTSLEKLLIYFAMSLSRKIVCCNCNVQVPAQWHSTNGGTNENENKNGIDEKIHEKERLNE